MKILYFLDWPVSIVGGAQKSTYTIANELAKFGNVTYICCPKSVIKEKKENINFIFHDITGNNFFDKMKKMKFYKSVLKKYKIDVVHVQNPTSFSIIGLMLFFNHGLRKNIKYVFTDRYFFSAYKLIQRKWFGFITRYFDKIICTTKLNKNMWLNVCKDVIVIPNALDCDWYDYDYLVEENYRQEANLKSEFVLGFGGRFVTYKRWDTVLKICEKLKHTEVRFCFAFATANEEEDEKLEKFLKNINECIKDRFLVFKNIDAEEMKKFYYLLDCFVLTSEKESFGRTLLEAMTKKCVVFGTNSGGVPEVIGDENFLFEVDKPEKVIEYIKKNIGDKKQIDSDKQIFMERVQKSFSIMYTIEEHISLYKTLLQEQEILRVR